MRSLLDSRGWRILLLPLARGTEPMTLQAGGGATVQGQSLYCGVPRALDYFMQRTAPGAYL